jgi:hypothetical protein
MGSDRLLFMVSRLPGQNRIGTRSTAGISSLLRAIDSWEFCFLHPQLAKGKYNSVDGCCLFDRNKQLNRQFVQWLAYLSVYKTFNSIFDTYITVIMCTFDLCSHFDAQFRGCPSHLLKD